MRRLLPGLLFLLLPGSASAQTGVTEVRARVQALLDSVRQAGKYPGATLAVRMPNGEVIAIASGLSDTARRIPMRPEDRMLQGSVGKTYVAAVAMQLVAEGRLDLNARIATYLGDEPWFARLPNGASATVRQVMNHTSGLVRYEFQPEATAVLRREPYKVWTPAERLSYILGTAPPFAAGEGWEYSDTNYIILGMIIERITGRPFYDEATRRVLGPHRLTETVPSDRPEIPGLVTGYAGPRNELGGYDASIVNGRMAINPQFEWTGGGMASTTADLARWAAILYEGRAFPDSLLPVMLDAVPARLGQNVRYGLGVIVRTTPLGPAHGHSGFFPGYATEMAYFPDLDVAVALQINVTDPYPRGMFGVLMAAARLTR